jgi:hypothetical protein
MTGSYIMQNDAEREGVCRNFTVGTHRTNGEKLCWFWPLYARKMSHKGKSRVLNLTHVKYYFFVFPLSYQRTNKKPRGTKFTPYLHQETYVQ